jgi:transcriptional regulator with XRE-family HTH domain
MASPIRLRKREFEMYCRLASLTTDTAIAQFLGVSSAALSRILRGGKPASAEFIGSTLEAFRPKGVRFEDLFDVVLDSTGDDGQAA